MRTLIFSRPARRAAAACIVLMAGATSAMAQAPAANVPTYGPPLTGVCIFSRDTALGTSQAGVSANQQLQQISKTLEAGLTPERDAIAKEDQTLTAEKAKLSAADYQKRAAALQKRAQAYTNMVQARNAQFTQTRDKATDQIATAVTPLLVASITEHHCSLVLERGGIYGANAAMDLTADVIQKLNAALPTVAVSLAPPQAGPAQP
jgi:Skp family chaperone for outer membrane proteins